MTYYQLNISRLRKCLNNYIETWNDDKDKDLLTIYEEMMNRV